MKQVKIITKPFLIDPPTCSDSCTGVSGYEAQITACLLDKSLIGGAGYSSCQGLGPVPESGSHLEGVLAQAVVQHLSLCC